MVNTEMLNKRIDESGLKRAYIAQELGMTRQSLSYKVNNNSEFLSSEVQGLCKLLGITRLREKEALFFASEVD